MTEIFLYSAIFHAFERIEFDLLFEIRNVDALHESTATRKLSRQIFYL